MNYIINPMWFYWLQLFNGAKIVCCFFLIASILLFVVLLATYLTSVDYCDLDDEDTKQWLKYVKKCLIGCIAFAIATVVIPSKDTLIEMQIAKYATVENANWTLETIKSAVDYIVESVKSMK